MQRLKIVQIGNSYGFRVSKKFLDRYGVEKNDQLEYKERDGTLIITMPNNPKKLSEEETYKAMAKEIKENGNDFEDFQHVDLENWLEFK